MFFMYIYVYGCVYANGSEFCLNISVCTCVFSQDKGVKSNQVVLTCVCVCVCVGIKSTEQQSMCLSAD